MSSTPIRLFLSDQFTFLLSSVCPCLSLSPRRPAAELMRSGDHMAARLATARAAAIDSDARHTALQHRAAALEAQISIAERRAIEAEALAAEQRRRADEAVRALDEASGDERATETRARQLQESNDAYANVSAHGMG